MTWQEQLIKSAEEIVKHGDGVMTLSVNPLGGYKTVVKIEAGKAFRFQVNKIVDD